MEGCRVAPHGAVVFRSLLWRGFRADHSSQLPRVARGRFVFLHPIDPRAHAITSGPPPLLPVAGGLFDVAPEEHEAPARRPFLPWSALGPVRAEGSILCCEGFGSLPCASAATARLWARALETMRTAAPARRAALAQRWLALRMHVPHARRRHRRTQRACRWLTAFHLAAFPLLLLGAAALLQRQSASFILGFLGTGILFGLTTAPLYLHAYRQITRRSWLPGCGRALMVATCFPVAFRARATLPDDSFAAFHPVALGGALLSQPNLRTFLAQAYRRWSYPIHPPAPDTAEAAAFATATRNFLACIATAARQAGVDPALLAAPPPLDDPTIHSWCPRCHATYTHTSGDCPHCPGIPLTAASASK